MHQHKSCPRLCTGAEDKAEASPCLLVSWPQQHPTCCLFHPPRVLTPMHFWNHQPAGKTLGSQDPLQDVECELHLTRKSLASLSPVSSCNQVRWHRATPAPEPRVTTTMNSPPSPQSKEKQSQDLPKGTGIKRSQAKGRSRRLSFTPSRTRAFQGHLVWWQLQRRPQPAPYVRPGQEPTAGAGLGWRLSLWLCFPSRGGSYCLPSTVSRGAARGAPGRRRKGWDTENRDTGNPGTRGAGGQDGAAEGGRGRRWDGGEEVRLCSPPPQTTQGPQGGAGGKGERRGEGGGAAQAPARANLSEVRRGWEPWREDSQTDSFQL